MLRAGRVLVRFMTAAVYDSSRQTNLLVLLVMIAMQ
jgi:hypothetical protein